MISVEHETAEGRSCRVEVCEGTLGDKLRRGHLIQTTVRRQRDEEGSRDIISDLIELHTFPSCIACSRNLSDTADDTIQVEGMTFEQFCSLPEQFVEKWATAVFELNSGWRDDAGFPQLGPSKELESNKSS